MAADIAEKYKPGEQERGKMEKGTVYGRGGTDKDGERGREMKRGGD